MRTFIIKARKGTTRWEKLRSTVGGKEHFEVVAHSVINAFFVSSDFREDVEVYIILDSSEDFPRTIKLSSAEGLSLAGFHEEAVIGVVEHALKNSQGLQKNETKRVAPGIEISGFGFEKLTGDLLKTRKVYWLSPKAPDIRDLAEQNALDPNPVFVLSDHLAMPPKSIKGLERQGLESVSLGRKMLFAAQCVVILHYEMDRAQL